MVFAHAEIIRKNFTRLVTEIDPVSLTSLLYEQSVLSLNQIDEILDKSRKKSQAISLLLLISRKPPHIFHIFCDCLRIAGRSETANLLEEKN